MFRICVLAKEIFEREPTLLRLTVPDDAKITIVGDLHGQLGDLLTIFTLNGKVKNPSM